MNDDKSYNKQDVQIGFNQIASTIAPNELIFDHYDTWMNQVYAKSLVWKDFPNTGIEEKKRTEIWLALREKFPRIGFCVLNNHTIYYEKPIPTPPIEEEENLLPPIGNIL